MATIAAPPAPHPAIIVKHERYAQGAEGRCIELAKEKAFEHWNERAEIFIGEAIFDESPYRHVPFERAFSAKVKYRLRGNIEPRRFAVEE